MRLKHIFAPRWDPVSKRKLRRRQTAIFTHPVDCAIALDTVSAAQMFPAKPSRGHKYAPRLSGYFPTHGSADHCGRKAKTFSVISPEVPIFGK
jgi:hypothetical protein